MATPDIPDVSVIVPTRDSERTLQACLESIRRQEGVELEIIVVDNFSSDRTLETASSMADRVIQTGPERSAQRNAGAWAARADYLLFIDSDMVLDPGVARDCLSLAGPGAQARAAIITETSVGQGFWADCRILERSCYQGDPLAEEARFFERNLFEECKGYNENLTGGEMKDLSARAGGFTDLPETGSLIVHNEQRITLRGSTRKKYRIAHSAHKFMVMHPALAFRRGNLVLRGSYLKNWRKLISDPLHMLGLFALRLGETFGALFGMVEGLLQDLSPWPSVPVPGLPGSLAEGRSIDTGDYREVLVRLAREEGGDTDPGERTADEGEPAGEVVVEPRMRDGSRLTDLLAAYRIIACARGQDNGPFVLHSLEPETAPGTVIAARILGVPCVVTGIGRSAVAENGLSSRRRRHRERRLREFTLSANMIVDDNHGRCNERSRLASPGQLCRALPVERSVNHHVSARGERDNGTR